MVAAAMEGIALGLCEACLVPYTQGTACKT